MTTRHRHRDLFAVTPDRGAVDRAAVARDDRVGRHGNSTGAPDEAFGGQVRATTTLGEPGGGPDSATTALGAQVGGQGSATTLGEPEGGPTSATTALGEHLAARPFALALSSGFFGFYAHAGMVLALEEAGLVPARLSGSSAGALVAGLWAAGLPARAMVDELLALERADFWDPAPGPGLLRGDLFRRRVERLVSSVTLESCRVPIAMSAFDIARRRTVVLDRGDLASAVCASCAFPLLLHPVRRDGRLLYDGGIGDRPGLAGLASQPRGEPTLHHHLGSRSPWRRRGSPGIAVPVRASTISLRIAGLPRVHPFRLGAGRAALHAAYRATRRALSAPAAPLIDV